jgi:MSHA pilin protein MshC
VSIANTEYRVRPSRLAGFTLVELVVTLVLVGLIAGVVGPRFFTASDYQGRGFFEEMASAMRYAQKEALVTGCPVQVTITAAGYSLVQQNANCFTTPAAPFSQSVLNPVTGAAFTNAPASGVVVASTVSPFFYCPQGHVAASSANCTAGTVMAANAVVTVGTLQFTVVRGSGYVSIP